MVETDILTLNFRSPCLILLLRHVMMLPSVRLRRSPQRLVVQEEPGVHVLGLSDERVPAVVGVEVLGRDVGGGDEAPAEGLYHVEQEAQQVHAPRLIRVESLGVPRVPLELPLDALAVVPGPERNPVLLDRLVHLAK